MPSKYKNRRTNGYDSKKEANYAVILRNLLTTGSITCLQEQIRYELLPAMGKNRAVHYVLDFMYRDGVDGKWHYVDVKGYKTEVYKLKKKMMLAVHGIEIEEV